MHTTYRLNTNELNQSFLDGLKAKFPGREVEITVCEVDETDYLFESDANRERLLAAKANLERGENLVEVSLQDLSQ